MTTKTCLFLFLKKWDYFLKLLESFSVVIQRRWISVVGILAVVMNKPFNILLKKGFRTLLTRVFCFALVLVLLFLSKLYYISCQIAINMHVA